MKPLYKIRIVSGNTEVKNDTRGEFNDASALGRSLCYSLRIKIVVPDNERL